jgi:hypothetical protein
VPEFAGYPLSTDFTDDTPNLGNQADAHNDERAAINDLQGQITALESTITGLTDSIATLSAFKALFDSPTSYTPTLTNMTVGASPGERWGRYVRFGDLVFYEFGFLLGAGFTMDATQPFGISLPFDADDALLTGSRRPVFTCYANNVSGTRRTSGAGIIFNTELTRISRFANENTGVGWDASAPFTWEVGDDFEGAGFYWAEPV